MTTSCFVCGAPSAPLELTCTYCGSPLSVEKFTDHTYVDALRNILENIRIEYNAKPLMAQFVSNFSRGGTSAAQARLDAIMTFRSPTEGAKLLNFFQFCHANALMEVNWQDDAAKKERAAWSAKAKTAYFQLKTISSDDKKLLPIIEAYDRFYGPKSERKIKVKPAYIGWGLGIVFVASAIVSGIRSESNEKDAENRRLERTIEATQRYINQGKYEAAKAEAANIRWRLNPGANEGMVKAYDDQRNDLMSAINRAEESER